MVRSKRPTDLNVVPWLIIGQAAYAQSIMNRFPEDHPIHMKHKLHYDALHRLSEQLSLPSEIEASRDNENR